MCRKTDFVTAEKGKTMCEYCSRGWSEVPYQEGTYGKLYFVGFGRKNLLVFEPHLCPPYAECSCKDVPIRMAFLINYCPNCGADLRERKNNVDI